MTRAALSQDAAVPEQTRLRSLDVLRGLTIVGMILVNSAAYLKYVGNYPAYPALMHSEWAGFTLADAVFPAFIFMVGVSLVWPLGQVKARGVNGGDVAAVAWRAFRLVLIGVLLSNLDWFAHFTADGFRPMGVLQRIGLVYLAAALLFLFTGPRTRIAIAVVILLAHWPLLLVPSPDGTATDLHQRGLNFAAWVDRAVLGQHLYVKGPAGYDPEGLLGTLPATAQALLGVAAGEWLKARGREPRSLGLLAAAGAAMAVLGLLWSPVLPVIKDVWSGSFVLLSSGLALVVLAGLAWALDLKGWRLLGAGVFAVFGVNAIAAYVLHYFASGLLTGDAMRWIHDLFAGWLPADAAALVPVLVFIAMIWAAMAYLARRRWFIRV
jgi:predicted acyltransferase